MVEIFNIIFLAITIISAAGLSYIIYSRSEAMISRLFILALILVIGYVISHAVHFLIMNTGDVTILDQSCHSFLLLIIVVLTFFSYYFPDKETMPFGLKIFILLPTIVLLFMLWNGNLVEESHKHLERFEAHYTPYYAGYLVWYIFLLVFSATNLINKIYSTDNPSKKKQIKIIFVGLIITNLLAFIFGIYLPWILGFYYLVEISPLAFLIGVILTAAIAVSRFNMFPSASNKFNSFSLTKKVFFAAIVIVPIIILMIQIPFGRILFDINSTMELERYFLLSLFGGLLVSVSMAFVIVKIISSPINSLIEKTNLIQKGNYGIYVDINSNDEIGRLAFTFNEMSNALKNDSIEIAENQQRIKMLLDAFEKSDTGICLLDPEGEVLEANITFAEIAGVERKALISKNIKDCSSKILSEITDELPEHLPKTESYQKEFKVVENGNLNFYLTAVTPFFKREKEFSGFLMVILNITKTKNLENELAKSEKLAALGKMAAVLAHEIKTPLTSIKMNSDILAETLQLSEADKKSFSIINREVIRLKSLVKEVLQFSRQMDLNKSWFNINSLAEDIRHQNLERFRRKNFSLKNKIDDVEIYADKEKMEQVFLNLIDNSFESAPDGELIIESSSLNGNIKINFIDNGSGISGELRDKILEPFYTTKASGTGLGLAVAQKIIEQHFGKIKLVSSEPGKTVFEISLPIKS